MFPYTEYMVLGYSAAGLLFAALVGSLVLRARRLKQELTLLKALNAELDAENNSQK